MIDRPRFRHPIRQLWAWISWKINVTTLATSGIKVFGGRP